MYTNLDWLIIAVLFLSVVGTAAVLIMFLSKQERIKSFSLHAAAIIGICAAWAGTRIFWLNYTGQLLIALVLGAMSVAAIVLKHMSKERSGFHTASHVMAALSCIGGILNAFM
ncbi:MAG: hypothetical protein IKU32_03970 [Clostridia bacterium]|nr:hypothetical protein [Clostridia bacterium]